MKYKILSAPTLINEEQLNQLSFEGWRLVSVVKSDNLFYFYFEQLFERG